MTLFPHALPQFQAVHVIIVSLLGSAIIWAFYNLAIYPLFLNPLRHLPGPNGGYPLVGYELEHMKRPMSLRVYHWITKIPNNGLVRHSGLFGRSLHIPTTPRILSELLVKKAYDFQKTDEGRALLRRLLGDGLVVAEGDVHKFQRKNLNPMFSFRHIKNLYPLMWAKSLDLIQCVKNDAANKINQGIDPVFELNEWASRATLDIIGVAALGRNFNSLHNANDELSQLYQDALRIDKWRQFWFVMQISFPSLDWLFDLLPWKTHQEIVTNARKLRMICNNLLTDKRSAISKEYTESVDTLAHLIRSNNFADSELVDQLLTMLAAGHETTSSAFTWLLAVLARNPSYQARLRTELRTHLDPSLLSEPSADLASVLESLPYLNAICSETLRLYPTVPIIRRVAFRDTQLGEFQIPKGTRFVIPLWWLNRAPALWGEDALEFKPERWIDVDVETAPETDTREATAASQRVRGRPNMSGGAANNYAFLTFIHGPRSCIGQGFARAELRCLVAAWVMSFEFGLAREEERIQEEGNVTVKPKGGLWLRVRELREQETVS